MAKFTFKLEDRMKLSVEKVSPRVNFITVHGKYDTPIKITNKDAKDIVEGFKSVCMYPSNSFEIQKEEIKLTLKFSGEGYNLVVTEGNKTRLNTKFNKKFLKKVYRTMREVFEIEQK